MKLAIILIASAVALGCSAVDPESDPNGLPRLDPEAEPRERGDCDDGDPCTYDYFCGAAEGRAYPEDQARCADLWGTGCNHERSCEEETA